MGESLEFFLFKSSPEYDTVYLHASTVYLAVTSCLEANHWICLLSVFNHSYRLPNNEIALSGSFITIWGRNESGKLNWANFGSRRILPLITHFFQPYVDSRPLFRFCYLSLIQSIWFPYNSFLDTDLLPNYFILMLLICLIHDYMKVLCSIFFSAAFFSILLTPICWSFRLLVSYYHKKCLRNPEEKYC